MKDFKGKTAVVTGAARGIGLEICKECARRGAKVVMADIDLDELAKAAPEVLALGAQDVMTTYCDVSTLESVEKLAKDTVERFQTVDALFCNAGVTALGDVVNTPVRDFEFCIKTDLYSVYYFLHVFVPIMREQGTECHIEVTASAASFSATPGMPIYHAAKYGVLGMCEPVWYGFLLRNEPIGMTLLFPGMVKTDIAHCNDRRPPQFAIDENDPYYKGMVFKAGIQASVNDTKRGQSPEEVVQMLFDAIEHKRFYCHTRPQLFDAVDYRLKVLRGEERYNIQMFYDFMKHSGDGDKPLRDTVVGGDKA